MANKRSLKRQIALICGELFAEAVAMGLYGENASNESTEAILFSIVKMENDFICRISHPEPGMKAKQYYKTLREDFSARTSELVDQIQNL